MVSREKWMVKKSEKWKVNGEWWMVKRESRLSTALEMTLFDLGGEYF